MLQDHHPHRPLPWPPRGVQGTPSLVARGPDPVRPLQPRPAPPRPTSPFARVLLRPAVQILARLFEGMG